MVGVPTLPVFSVRGVRGSSTGQCSCDANCRCHGHHPKPTGSPPESANWCRCLSHSQILQRTWMAKPYFKHYECWLPITEMALWTKPHSKHFWRSAFILLKRLILNNGLKSFISADDLHVQLLIPLHSNCYKNDVKRNKFPFCVPFISHDASREIRDCPWRADLHELVKVIEVPPM